MNPGLKKSQAKMTSSICDSFPSLTNLVFGIGNHPQLEYKSSSKSTSNHVFYRLVSLFSTLMLTRWVTTTIGHVVRVGLRITTSYTSCSLRLRVASHQLVCTPEAMHLHKEFLQHQPCISPQVHSTYCPGSSYCWQNGGARKLAWLSHYQESTLGNRKHNNS